MNPRDLCVVCNGSAVPPHRCPAWFSAASPRETGLVRVKGHFLLRLRGCVYSPQGGSPSVRPW